MYVSKLIYSITYTNACTQTQKHTHTYVYMSVRKRDRKSENDEEERESEVVRIPVADFKNQNIHTFLFMIYINLSFMIYVMLNREPIAKLILLL